MGRIDTEKVHAKWLKPCNGFHIDKSWKLKADGTINKNSIVYTVYETMDGDFVDCFESLADAQEFCKRLGNVLDALAEQ